LLALAQRAAGDLEAALGSISRAVELAPANAVYRNNYGVILAESGMLAEAVSQWRRVLEVDGDNAAARENLSRFAP
jgi:Flp pilus assembly protein TadD